MCRQWCMVISGVICEMRIMRYIKLWSMSLPLEMILFRTCNILNILGGKNRITIPHWHICMFIAFCFIRFLIHLWRNLPTVWFRKCHNIILFTHFFSIYCKVSDLTIIVFSVHIMLGNRDTCNVNFIWFKTPIIFLIICGFRKSKPRRHTVPNWIHFVNTR